MEEIISCVRNAGVNLQSSVNRDYIEKMLPKYISSFLSINRAFFCNTFTDGE